MSLDITVEAVCQFITDHGGKVKNTVLVSYFKKVLNNPETKDSARQKFKECVNTVAVVKTENGEKYVQLKKKYRSSLSAASSASEISGDGVPPLTPPADSTNSPSKSLNEPNSSHEMSFTSPEEMPYADESEHSTHSSSRTSKHDRSSSPASHNGEHKSKNSSQHQLSPKQKATSSQPTEPKELSPSKHRKDPSHKLETTHATMSAPVEAPQGAAASPKKQASPRKQSRAGQSETTRTAEEKPAPAAKSQPHVDSSTFTAPSSVLMRKKKERKENVPPSPNLDHRMSSLERVKASLQNAPAEQRIARTRPVSVMQGSYVGSVERVRQNFQNKQRLNEDSASLALSEKSLDSKGEEQDYDEERPLPNVVLDINEKAWIIQSSKGSLVEMRKLLNVDQTLADRKDFVLTALHWAAKKGNIDMVHMLIDQKVDINARSNGGYTPLHFAAMHGHENVLTLLLENDADANIRDYSGRLAIHYLKTVSLPLQSKNGYESKLANWRYHSHCGNRINPAISEDIFKRFSDKLGAHKKSHAGHDRESGPDVRQRANSSSSNDQRSSNGNGSSRSTKLNRTESVFQNIALWRKASMRKSKHSHDHKSDHDIDTPSPPPLPMSRPAPSVGAMMWKPAGPKA